MTVLVTACILARDEELNIGACIRSVSGLADEVVVIDTGSIDSTPRIAEDLGARVYHEQWGDDFALHRNQAFDRARGQWVLVIDADEKLLPGDPAETRRVLESGDLPDVLMVRHISALPGGQQPVEYLARWVRRGSGIRYMHRVHEQLAVRDVTAVLSDTVLLHHGYQDEAKVAAKLRRNLALAEQMPDDEPHAHHCRMRSYAGLGRWAECARSAEALLAMKAHEMVHFDAHILLAAGLFNAPLVDMERIICHVEAAERLDPRHPDATLLRLLILAEDYLRQLQPARGFPAGSTVRVGHFWDQGDAVRQFLRTFLTRCGRNDGIDSVRKLADEGDE